MDHIEKETTYIWVAFFFMHRHVLLMSLSPRNAGLGLADPFKTTILETYIAARCVRRGMTRVLAILGSNPVVYCQPVDEKHQENSATLPFDAVRRTFLVI